MPSPFMTRVGSRMLLAGIVLTAASLSQAATITINMQNGAADANYYPAGYTGTHDTTIYYYAGSTGGATPTATDVYPRTNAGANNTIRVREGSTNNRGLIRFDTSALQNKGITVTSATLTFRQSSAGAATGTVLQLFKIADANAGWNEGNGNVASHNPVNTPTVATSVGEPTFWYKSIGTLYPTAVLPDGGNPSSTDSTGTRWASGYASMGVAGSTPTYLAGGLWNVTDLQDWNTATPATNATIATTLDPVGTGASTATVGNLMTITLPAALVQSWIDSPSTNAGLFMRYNGGSTNIDFNSSEASTISQRPLLSIVAEVPEPAALGLTSAFGLIALRRARKA
ncbi:MAG: DNRLRE domain-containing protein [Tepidisphaeraceae bacterium]